MIAAFLFLLGMNIFILCINSWDIALWSDAALTHAVCYSRLNG
ncbi:hypothetical protein DFO54_10182 [Erwinia sp. AG740]|nr:hypothetical protein DFO54_10182 [Erwinia sp. AG740]